MIQDTPSNPPGNESKKSTISHFNMNPQLTTINTNKIVHEKEGPQPKIEVKKDIKVGQKKASVSKPNKQYDSTKSPVRVAMLSELTQTDNANFVNFACEMFLQALEAEAINGEEDEEKYQDLLKKAEHIIIRIRNKAATSYGLVGGGGFGLDKRDIGAVLASKPMSPSRYQPIEKSWHFDMSTKQNSRSPRRRFKV